LPPLDGQLQTDLRQRYEEKIDAETRTRYQMLVLAQQGYSVLQIARLVLRGEDTVTRTPDDLLRHIDSPFLLDKRSTQLQAYAA